MIWGVSEALNTHPSELMGYTSPDNPEANPERRDEVLLQSFQDALRRFNDTKIDIRHVIHWFHESGGDIRHARSLMDYVDLYDRPLNDPIYVNPIHVGQEGLTARITGITSAAGMVDALGALDDLSYCRRTAQLHRRVLKGDPQIGFASVDEALPNGRRATCDYFRIAVPARDGDRKIVLSYSERLSHLSTGSIVGYHR